MITREELRTVPAPCAGCNAMAAEVVLPLDDEAAAVCWLCAHMVAVHGTTLEAAPHEMLDCTCSREDVYPPDVLARADSARRGHSYPPGTLSDGETVSGELEDRSQKTGSFQVRTQVAHDDNVVVQSFERVDSTHIKLLSVDVRPFTREEKIARTLHRKGQAARAVMK